MNNLHSFKPHVNSLFKYQMFFVVYKVTYEIRHLITHYSTANENTAISVAVNYE